MASINNQTVQTGNRIYIQIKNHVIARAQSLSGSRSYGTQGIYQIGSIMPQEHVYLKYTGTISLERFRMIRDNLASATMDIARLGEDILTQDILDINVVDAVTKQLSISYRGCTANSYAENTRANEVVSENIEFSYLTSTNSSRS